MVTARPRNKIFAWVPACPSEFLFPRIPVPLARHLWYTTGDDFIPEFSEYPPLSKDVQTHKVILERGIRAPIFVSHYLKTTVAVQAQLQSDPKRTQAVLLAALNRFVHSPVKQTHSRRLTNQAIALVQRDDD